MPASIHPDVKKVVFKDWLAGLPRDKIAKHNTIGTGTVSSIVMDWIQGLVDKDIEPVRELTMQIRKQGMDLTECAEAARLVKRVKNLGGKTKGIDKLLTGIQSKCISRGLPSEKICELLIQLFNISKSQSIPLESVPDHIERNIQNLMQEYEDKKMKIHGMSLILGVPEPDILRWNEVLRNYRDVITTESLADDMEHYGSIRKATLKEYQKVKDLRMEQSCREAEIESLKKAKDRIEKSISVLEQNTIKTIERIGEASIQAVSNKASEFAETQGITGMSVSNDMFDDQNAQLVDHQVVEEKPPVMTYQKDMIAESS
jgi:hypothetical protein